MTCSCFLPLSTSGETMTMKSKCHFPSSRLSKTNLQAHCRITNKIILFDILLVKNYLLILKINLFIYIITVFGDKTKIASTNKIRNRVFLLILDGKRKSSKFALCCITTVTCVYRLMKKNKLPIFFHREIRLRTWFPCIFCTIVTNKK